MATPQPLDCLKTVCRWKTPAHFPDWDKMLQMLSIHTAAEDGINTAPPATTLTNTKLERLAWRASPTPDSSALNKKTSSTDSPLSRCRGRGTWSLMPSPWSDGLSGDNTNNILPNYSTSMGPPDCVSSPIHGATYAHSETEAYVLGAAMARLESLNKPEESLHGGIASGHVIHAGECLPRFPEYQFIHNLVVTGAP